MSSVTWQARLQTSHLQLDRLFSLRFPNSLVISHANFPRYRLQLAVVGVYCNDCRRAMNVVIAYLYVHAELRLLHDASL